jgi:hypothetical protein
MTIATILAFSYAVLNKNTELITNYGPILVLDVIALSMRIYYANKNNYLHITNINKQTIETEIVLQN